ncbi:hypothetical protein EIB75_10735 [Epilithonimonas vandammei]|uniref:Uncharacterized protein n=1 Tax=Epilithonimonas vandammei TaxID=2487072 RepID=A0A3G8ZEU5_9FLAO|nr:hypothetical protein [Epilithonimonas vandammei]AZI55698.1 hypothetical protein EIB75_10735 [Epilithonimonas vandammei]
MWKITKHKAATGQQELQVCIKVRELEYSNITYAESLIDEFRTKLKEVKRTNNFSANLMYKATPRNPKSVEIWKLTADADFNYKMFTLDYIGESPNPFNF